MGEPVVDVLEELWGSIHELGSDLDEEQWERPTDCPGWSVKDNLAHIIGTERMLLGEPVPAPVEQRPSHVLNDLGAVNEAAVDQRRPQPGAEVLAEFDQVTGQRLEQLRAMPTEAFEEVVWTPAGDAPYRDFMALRVFDCWVHEQDMRRAVGRPGNTEGPSAAIALARLDRAMPYVVGKRAAAPDGSAVIFDVDGREDGPLAVTVEGGRARPVEGGIADPTVRLLLDRDTYWRLGCGRETADRALADGRARVEGDEALGHRILASMAITP